MHYSNADLAKCARRELKRRERLYRNLVNAEMMNPKDADDEIAMMLQIAEHFETLTQPKLV